MENWKAYSDPLIKDKILMGYKGESYMDSGYIFAPYVPLTSTPVILDPDTFMPKSGVLSRYGKKILNQAGNHYAAVPKQSKFRSIFDPWEISQIEE